MKYYFVNIILFITLCNIHGQWQKTMDLPTQADVIYCSKDTIYLGMGNSILTSSDEGILWNNYAEFESERINKIIVKDNMRFIGLSRVIFGFPPIRFNMFRSLDYGKTWDSLYVLYNSNYYSSVGILDLTLHDDDLYCGINGRLLKSNDFGNTWFSDTYFDSNDYPYYPISLHSTGKHLLASFSEDSLYILKNGFSNWLTISKGLLKEDIYEIEGRGDTIIIVGVSNIYISYDAGNMWENINNNFPDSLNIYGMHLFNSQLFLTTDNARIFFSQMNEFIWREISEGLETTAHDYIFDMTQSQNKLFIIYNNAIYERRLDNIVSVEKENISNNVDYQINAYPNPFNNSTKINYVVPTGESVAIELYNMLGEKVKTIVENSNKSVGSIELEAKSFSSGVYIVMVRSNKIQMSKKIILLK